MKNNSVASGSKNGTRSGKAPKTKVERYDWKIKDEMPEFSWIDKTDLQIDETYQRNAVQSKVVRMAAKWSWKACSSLHVALRDDASWWVFDGQYRLLAARHRSDISHLPCLVFGVASKVEEAQGFLDVNTNRKPVEMVAKFRALVMAEDALALKAAALIHESGRQVSLHAGGRTITCVSALMRCIQYDEASMRRIWPLTLELCSGRSVHQRLLQALHHVEWRAKQSLTDQPWRGALIKIGYDGLLSGINKANAFYTVGGPKVWASGIIELVNRGRRNLLELSGTPSSRRKPDGRIVSAADDLPLH